MTNQSNSPRTRVRTLDGPVKPGSPLYRALEMIAREIAKDLENDSPSKDEPRGKVRP
jgi:hypothetical protein